MESLNRGDGKSMGEDSTEMDRESEAGNKDRQSGDLKADTGLPSNNESELHKSGERDFTVKEENISLNDKLDEVTIKESDAGQFPGEIDTNKDSPVKNAQSESNPKLESLNCDTDKTKESVKTEGDGKLTAGETLASENKNESDVEYFSDQSESGDEYESAEEGEEIQTDSAQLKEMEEKLTEEEKAERRNSAKDIKEEGNQLFRDGSYKSAIRMYSRGLRTCPLKFEKDRAVLYANRGACKWKLEELEEAIKDCGKAIDLNPDYMKALVRRAELYEKTEKLDEALADYQKILELDPSNRQARAACMKLPDMIKDRNEKLKEEMMGKLKDLGNMVLRPFGLSTNNFKLNQDPNTGGYSVNFVQGENANNSS